MEEQNSGQDIAAAYSLLIESSSASIYPPSQGVLRLAQRIGDDVMLCQGVNCNMSFKIGDVMWIKADGAHLADAMKETIFIPVDIQAVRDLASSGDAQTKDLKETALIEVEDSALSAEIFIHAMIAHKVMAHTFSANALAHTVSPQGRMLVKEKIPPNRGAFLPYARGQDLIDALRKSFREPMQQIFFLQHQGVLICEDRLDIFFDFMRSFEVEIMLPRKLTFSGTPEIDADAADEWIPLEDLQPIACNELWRERLTGGCYSLHQAILFGPEIPEADEILEEPAGAFAASLPVRVIPDDNIYVRRNISGDALSQLYALCDMIGRIPESWSLDSLSDEQIRNILASDSARKYRQAHL